MANKLFAGLLLQNDRASPATFDRGVEFCKNLAFRTGAVFLCWARNQQNVSDVQGEQAIFKTYAKLLFALLYIVLDVNDSL